MVLLGIEYIIESVSAPELRKLLFNESEITGSES